MLTPMEFQMLVGLCCLRRNPEAVSITIGDMVYDEATEQPRDVDVTVGVGDTDGGLALAAYDVKQHTRPLDSGQVDGLIRKLQDMPSLNEAAIVSASGFTAPATKKIRYHGLRMYQFRKWVPPKDFDPRGPGMRPAQFVSQELRWLTATPTFNHGLIDRETLHVWLRQDPPVFGESMITHPEFCNVSDAFEGLVQYTTRQLTTRYPSPEAFRAIAPAEELNDGPIGEVIPVEMLVEIRQPLFVHLRGRPYRLTNLHIAGNVQWYRQRHRCEQKEMVDCESGEVFAQSTVGRISDDIVVACACSTRDTKMVVKPIRLSSRHKHKIQQLALLAK